MRSKNLSATRQVAVTRLVRKLGSCYINLVAWLCVLASRILELVIFGIV